MANPLKPCPDCGEPAAMRGAKMVRIGGDGISTTGDGPTHTLAPLKVINCCPHPCHAAAQKVVETAVAEVQADCYDHADNCCDEWCDMCKRGKGRRRRMGEAKCALLAALEEE